VNALTAIDILASAHAFAAVAVVSVNDLPQLEAGLGVLADLPPPRSALRIHALYSVWLI
jgi:hypothetical protein